MLIGRLGVSIFLIFCWGTHVSWHLHVFLTLLGQYNIPFKGYNDMLQNDCLMTLFNNIKHSLIKRMTGCKWNDKITVLIRKVIGDDGVPTEWVQNVS